MRRTLIVLVMWAALATPVVASADDQTIPPEANWTPTPPSRAIVDMKPLASVLVEKGMITPYEHTQLTQPPASSASQHSRARVWTWEGLDRNSIRSAAGD